MYKLTGKIRFVSSIRGKLMLQVQVKGPVDPLDLDSPEQESWRYARTEDLCILEIGVFAIR